MRLPPLCIMLRSPMRLIAITAVLLILWIWVTRPPPVYSDWLGLVGFPDDSPLSRLLTWISEERAPRSPSGCLSLFEIPELFFAGMLLLALVLLLAPLMATFGESWLRRCLSSAVLMPQGVSLRCRVTTMLVAIAIMATYLGWEINAWRGWRARRAFLDLAVQSEVRERATLIQLQSKREELAKLESAPLPPVDLSLPDVGFYRSKAALAAERVVFVERRTRELNVLSARAAAFAARKRKHEQDAAIPTDRVAADLPLPEAEPEADLWVAQRDYKRALAAYDALAEAHPDYVEAYLIRGWIRATCPDARFRDGRIALKLGTRACELTNWKDTEALSTLAAAFAELGNYREAVTWQQKALSRTTDRSAVNALRERLSLYKAGKPYRQE